MSNKTKLQNLWKEACNQKNRASIIQFWEMAQAIYPNDQKYLDHLLRIRESISHNEIYDLSIRLLNEICDQVPSLNLIFESPDSLLMPDEVEDRAKSIFNGEIEYTLNQSKWLSDYRKVRHDYALDVIPLVQDGML